MHVASHHLIGWSSGASLRHGGQLPREASKRTSPQSASTYLAPSCFMLTNDPLARASHKAKSQVSAGGDAQGCTFQDPRFTGEHQSTTRAQAFSESKPFLRLHLLSTEAAGRHVTQQCCRNCHGFEVHSHTHTHTHARTSSVSLLCKWYHDPFHCAYQILP